jgi:NADPH:quinone reductase-like Zn-dependent oxidoreductase
VDVGNQVQSVEINDRVWAYLPLWASEGLMSEYAVISEKYVAVKPNNISYEGAATIPYAFVTFWERIIEKTGLSPQEAKNKRYEFAKT